MEMRVNEQVKADTRRALLTAAAQAFAEHGYHRANIDSVSEAAGLAKGTVYNYFPAKRAVFEAVLLEACALAAESADAVPARAPVRLRLEVFVTGNLEWARRNEGLAKLFARELIAGDLPTRELILDAAAPCVTKLTAILEEGQEGGELTLDAPPAALAVTFIVLANVLLLQASQGGVGWPAMEALPGTVAGLFLDGVAGGAR
jgi:AcrR family transcriptional regulator